MSELRIKNRSESDLSLKLLKLLHNCEDSIMHTIDPFSKCLIVLCYYFDIATLNVL